MSAPPEWEPQRDAGRAFLSGFAGCLGVGLAVIFGFVLLLIVAAILTHH